MTEFIAYVALAICGLGVVLGNYWFTYGLWPRSWASFVLFGIASILLAMVGMVIKEERR